MRIISQWMRWSSRLAISPESNGTCREAPVRDHNCPEERGRICCEDISIRKRTPDESIYQIFLILAKQNFGGKVGDLLAAIFPSRYYGLLSAKAWGIGRHTSADMKASSHKVRAKVKEALRTPTREYLSISYQVSWTRIRWPYRSDTGKI